jgi:hypothetical protein
MKDQMVLISVGGLASLIAFSLFFPGFIPSRVSVNPRFQKYWKILALALAIALAVALAIALAVALALALAVALAVALPVA